VLEEPQLTARPDYPAQPGQGPARLGNRAENQGGPARIEAVVLLRQVVPRRSESALIRSYIRANRGCCSRDSSPILTSLPPGGNPPARPIPGNPRPTNSYASNTENYLPDPNNRELVPRLANVRPVDDFVWARVISSRGRAAGA